jgi:hypothetical protein
MVFTLSILYAARCELLYCPALWQPGFAFRTEQDIIEPQSHIRSALNFVNGQREQMAN